MPPRSREADTQLLDRHSELAVTGTGGNMEGRIQGDRLYTAELCAHEFLS